MIKGNVYEIVYKLQSGNYRWYMYRATMTYLGYSSPMDEEIFSLRPLAGTQMLPTSAIMDVRDLGPSQGGGDSRHKLKVRMGELKGNARG